MLYEFYTLRESTIVSDPDPDSVVFMDSEFGIRIQDQNSPHKGGLDPSRGIGKSVKVRSDRKTGRLQFLRRKNYPEFIVDFCTRVFFMQFLS